MFEYFPGNYWWSAMVVNSLGMGGEVSGIGRFCGPLKEVAGTQSWGFAARWWEYHDPYRRHEPLLYNAVLHDVGTRRLEVTPQHPTGSVTIPGTCPHKRRSATHRECPEKGRAQAYTGMSACVAMPNAPVTLGCNTCRNRTATQPIRTSTHWTKHHLRLSKTPAKQHNYRTRWYGPIQTRNEQVSGSSPPVGSHVFRTDRSNTRKRAAPAWGCSVVILRLSGETR